MPLWVIYSLSAAVLYGLGYAAIQKLINEGFSSFFILISSAIVTIPLLLCFPRAGLEIKTGMELLLSHKKWIFLVIAVELMVVIANYLVLTAIGYKNATLVSLVEISYPLFVFLFTWMFFKESQLTWTTGFGGLLIFSGIALIYLKS